MGGSSPDKAVSRQHRWMAWARRAMLKRYTRGTGVITCLDVLPPLTLRIWGGRGQLAVAVTGQPGRSGNELLSSGGAGGE